MQKPPISRGNFPWCLNFKVKMRLSLLFLLTVSFIMQANSTYSQQTKISLDMETATVEAVMEEIETKTEFKFFFNTKTVDLKKRVKINVKQASVEEVLKQLFKGMHISFEVDDRKILLKKQPVSLKDVSDNPSHGLVEMQLQVTGTVSDDQGQPLPGASIVEKGTTNGTQTDFDGNFNLEVASENSVLVVSYIGFSTKEIPVTDGTILTITLEESAAGLDEVVLVGYGTQRRSDVTGSVASIKSDQLSKAPIGQVSNSLQGLASGMEIVSDGGSPGASPVIQIRGTGSINSSNPLIVIDGVPSGQLSDINPNDIEQIEVLKDASSAAIYGTRAANGVILVTTKSGRLNTDTKINLNVYSGISEVSNKLNLLKANDLVMLKKERYANDGITPNEFWNNNYYTVNRTDWQNSLFQTGHFQNVDLGISGGNERSSYLTSMGYYNEEGIILSSKFERLSARFNSTHRLSDRLKINQNFQYSYKNWYNPNTSSVYSGVLWQALRFNPAIPSIDENGVWGSAAANNELGDINNPVYELTTEDHTKRNHNLLTSLSLEYKVSDDLILKGNVGLDGNLYKAKDFFPSVTEQMRRRNDAELSITQESNYTLLGEAYLNYSKYVGNHNFEIVAGVSSQSSKGEYQYTSKRGFGDETLNQIVFDNGATMNSITGNFNVPEKLASVFGRVNYAYQNKYLLTATLRSDGSSKFAKGNQWGYFPGFSVGWKLSEEEFLNEVDFLSDLKVKGGWGKLGNQEVADLQYLTLIQRNIDYGNKYTFGTEKVGGALITSLGNPMITWEKTAMTNIGLESSFFNHALFTNITWFDKRTTDMLIPSVMMGSIGRATIPDYNIGELRNWGWEIEVGYRKTYPSSLSYNVGMNLTLIKNEVSKLYGNNNYISSVFYGRQSQEISRTYESMPLASFFGWKTDGIYQNQAEVSSDPNISNDPRRDDITPGDVRFLDINADGVIDEKDRTYLGDPNPNAIVGLQLGVDYKKFSLSANFVGNFGAELYNADRMQGLDPTYSYNMYEETLNRWHGEGTSNSIPKMSTQRTNLNHRTSDLFIESGDFVKLKTLTLGYQITPKNSILFDDLSVYIMAENLFTITGYSGYNPEIGYSDGNLQRGVDYANYPFSRKLSLGFRFTF